MKFINWAFGGSYKVDGSSPDGRPVFLEIIVFELELSFQPSLFENASSTLCFFFDTFNIWVSICILDPTIRYRHIKCIDNYP